MLVFIDDSGDAGFKLDEGSIRVVASSDEHPLITTDPSELYDKK